MVSFNPIYYLKHAWSATNSVWGKVSIVLFYSFVWLEIIWGIQLILAPQAGWKCFYEPLGPYELAFLSSMMRQQNVLGVGFFLYADRGGIKVWNTAMVFAVILAYSLAWLTAYNGYKHAKNAPSCDDSMKTGNNLIWAQLIWSALALAFSWLDSRAAPTGSAAETTSLV